MNTSCLALGRLGPFVLAWTLLGGGCCSQGAIAQEPDPKLAKEIAGLRKALASSDFEERAEAAEALAKIGPPAKATLPDLFTAMLDASDYDPEIGSVGRSVSSAHFAILKIGSPHLIAECIAKLRTVGEGHLCEPFLASTLHDLYRPGIPEVDRMILDGMGDESKLVRIECVNLIIRRDVKVPGAIPLLIKILETNSGGDAAGALSRYGSEASAAIPILEKRYRDQGNPHSRRVMSLDALAHVGSDDRRIATLLHQAFKDQTRKDDRLREVAAHGLGISKYGAIARNYLVAHIVETAKSKAFREEEGAYHSMEMSLQALSKLPPDKASISAMIQVLDLSHGERVGHRQIRKVAMEIIAANGADADQAVPTLLAQIERHDVLLPQDALDPLRRILGERFESTLRMRAKVVADPVAIERYRHLGFDGE